MTRLYNCIEKETTETTMTDKPYADYRFLGVHSFVETLKSSGTDHRIFEDDLAPLFKKYGEILKEGEDTVRTGIILREGQGAYFAEFGIRLTRSFRSHIVFIFGHHPTVSDLEAIVLDLESIVEKCLEGVNLSALAESMEGDGRTIQ